MNKLSYLEKLLDGVEVEWLTAAEIFNIKNGYTPSKAKKEFWEDGNIPWFRLEDIRTNGRELNDSIMHVNQAGVKGNLFPKDSIFMSTTATIGEFALVKIPHLTNQQITNFSLTSRFKGIIDIRYLFHRFHHFGEWCKENANKSGGLSIIGIKKLSSYKFPIPCPDNPEKSLAIQSEIVRILDKFTALTAELTAELTMRKKQYNYYRNQLLSFEEGAAPFYPLGQKEVGEFIRGGSFQKKDFTKSGVGCIHYGQIFTHYGTYANKTKTFVSESLAQKCRKAKTGNLVIATTSENDDDVCKAVAWLGTEDIAVSSDACIYRHNLTPKYVSYFFQTESFQSQKRQYITGTKVRRVNADNLAKILIPVPSQEEQTRIVDILDKFDLLTSSISQGLPREIELRQKQYEYYRDLLFSFPRPETASN
ncbi:MULTISPECIES: restriction endonuclease subunit S [Enterobacteriaceae]|nr:MULTISPECIES: restriction endonuclease subunit S [Enterobacteriaceae]CZY47527.1 type-1 restriction enzyme specificity protein [Enterobacter cloacae]HAS0804444.1 restriction endonuclease subunit S [Enterobacter roggenkampii]KVJ06668.1 restriction endonuclease [Enterobacter asburiae]MBX8630634.1 restriction endonuclease subunit S [Enterobacter hormaechei]MBY5093950.1 restriction endonuclease subunit S [Citrobacter freundii]